MQAVLLGSGIYDFSHGGGTVTGDPANSAVDIYSRFVTAWGTTSTNLLQWQMEGALYYMATTSSAPVFLSYNTDDAPFYPYQAQLMAAKLASLGVSNQIVTGLGGHHVTTNFTTLTAIYNFFKAHANPQPNQPGKTVLSNYNSNALTVDLKIDANGNSNSVMYAIYTDATPRQWVQANGTVGTNAVWRTLADWGLPVRVGPLTILSTVRFAVIAYDPTNFTTTQNSTNVIPPQVGNLSIEPLTGTVSFAWSAPTGVTDPGDLSDVVQRSTNLNNDWAVVPDAVITISNGTVSFTDPTPPTEKAFYRVTRP